MLAKALFVALGGAAIDTPLVRHLVTRQSIDNSSIPTTCQSGCTGALTIYDACQSGDTTTCLTVCQASTFTTFVNCFSCVLANTPGVESSDYDDLNMEISSLQQACLAAGETVSATSLVTPSSLASESDDSPTGSATSGLIATATSVTFTSATSGGITIAGGSGGSATSAGVSTAGSGPTSMAEDTSKAAASAGGATSAAGAAVKSASAAATSAKSAGFAVAPMSSFGSAVISVLGLGAGLALVP